MVVGIVQQHAIYWLAARSCTLFLTSTLGVGSSVKQLAVISGGFAGLPTGPKAVIRCRPKSRPRHLGSSTGLHPGSKPDEYSLILHAPPACIPGGCKNQTGGDCAGHCAHAVALQLPEGQYSALCSAGLSCQQDPCTAKKCHRTPKCCKHCPMRTACATGSISIHEQLLYACSAEVLGAQEACACRHIPHHDTPAPTLIIYSR